MESRRVSLRREVGRVVREGGNDDKPDLVQAEISFDVFGKVERVAWLARVWRGARGGAA